MCTDEFWESVASVALVQAELDGGADPAASDSSGSTPLHFAMLHWALLGEVDPEIVRLLLENGADPSAKNDYGDWVMTGAVALGFVHGPEILGLLLEYGGNANGRDDFDDRPILHRAVIQVARSANPEVAKSFQDDGIDVAANSFELVELLLEHGADASARDEHGQSALFMYFGTLVQELLNQGESRNADPKLVKLLVESGAEVAMEEEHDAWLVTYAMWAWGNAEILGLLLGHGVDASARYEGGNTLLHIAAGFGMEPQVFQLLLHNGADIEATNSDGKTACDLVPSDDEETRALLCL